MLQEWRRGDEAALERLVPLVQDRLRELAHGYLARERPGHLLQTTSLVNEAYIKLIQINRVDWKDRAHFLAMAATVMRRVLVDYARARQREKRGGGAERVPLSEIALAAEARNIDLVALDEALTRLTAVDPRQARVVELRYFGGLGVDETAEVLRVSQATVKNEWRVARAWLRRELQGGESHDA